MTQASKPHFGLQSGAATGLADHAFTLRDAGAAREGAVRERDANAARFSNSAGCMEPGVGATGPVRAAQAWGNACAAFTAFPVVHADRSVQPGAAAPGLPSWMASLARRENPSATVAASPIAQSTSADRVVAVPHAMPAWLRRKFRSLQWSRRGAVEPVHSPQGSPVRAGA